MLPLEGPGAKRALVRSLGCGAGLSHPIFQAEE